MSDHWTLRPTSGTLVVCQIGTESITKGHFSLVAVTKRTWPVSVAKLPFWSVPEERDDLQTLRRLGGLKDQLSDSSSFHLPIEPGQTQDYMIKM